MPPFLDVPRFPLRYASALFDAAVQAPSLAGSGYTQVVINLSEYSLSFSGAIGAVTYSALSDGATWITPIRRQDTDYVELFDIAPNGSVAFASRSPFTYHLFDE